MIDNNNTEQDERTVVFKEELQMIGSFKTVNIIIMDRAF